MKKSKFLKSLPKKSKKISPAELAEQKKIAAHLDSIAESLVKVVLPHGLKCFVIVQDQKKNGASRSTADFTVEELKIYTSLIFEKNNTSL